MRRALDPSARRRHDPATFDVADAELGDVLAALEGADNYADWVYEQLAPDVRGRVLEVGAGSGTLSVRFARSGPLTALEPSPKLAESLRRRVLAHSGSRVIVGTLDDISDDERFDAVVLVNVLEHIADDEAALRRIRSLLEPGGRVVLWVPAFEALYGRFDHLIGHHRRYRAPELVTLCTDAGLIVRRARYANLPGFFAWLVIVRWLRKVPTAGRLATIYDRWFVPMTRRVERRIAPPFGQSLVVVAERPR